LGENQAGFGPEPYLFPFACCNNFVRNVPKKLLVWGHSNKKTDVAKHPEVFGHVGLLVNEPPGLAGLPFI
jgi:hypothetical protein